MNIDPGKAPEVSIAQKTQVMQLESASTNSSTSLARSWGLRPLVLLIGGFVLLIWSVLGFYLWIPLLIRTCAAFSAAIIGTVISGHDMSRAERALNEAIVFYSKGFAVITQSIRRVFEGRAVESTIEGQSPISWKRSILEFCLASAMWAAPFAIHYLSKAF